MKNLSFLFKNKKMVILYAILLIGALLRLLALYRYGLSLTLNSDDEGYKRSAFVFLQKHMLIYHDPNMPSVHIMPGFTFLLAFIFGIFGQGDLGTYAAKFVMILFGLGSIYGTYKLGTIVLNEWAGLIGSFLLAIFVPQILVDNLLLTESPYTAFSIFLFYFSIKLGNDKSWKTFYLVLLFYFLCIYIRPTIALYPILLFLYLILKKYPIKLMGKQIMVAAVALILLLGPWWIRNYIQFKEFIPLSGGSGDPLLLGTYQGIGFPDQPLNKIQDKINKEYKGQNAYYVMKAEQTVAKERIKEWIKTNPKSYLYSLFVLKPQNLWETQFYWIEIFRVKADMLNKLTKILLWGSLIGLFVSLIMEKSRRMDILLMGMVALYFTLINSYYFAYDRYNLPLMPLVFIFSGYLVYSILRIFFKRLS